MARTYAYSANFNKEVEKLFREAKLLGEGHNGIVYELPDNKAVKIFIDKDICREEAKILYKVRKSKFFPKIFKYDENYILREMVPGKRLDHYIKENGMSKKLVMNLYKLFNEMKRLKFSKLDARCRDIYVDEEENIKVIDPKQCYARKVSFPRHLMKGLKGIDSLDIFLNYMREIDYKSAKYWEIKFEEYCNEEE